MKPTFRQGYLLIVFCLLAICFLYVRFAILPKQQEHQQKIEQAHQQMLEQVARVANVDPAEMPVITAIIDVETLRAVHPDFYRDAEQGDLVLRYKDIVVLFRAETQSVIALQRILSAP